MNLWQRFRDWNANRKHLPDVHEHPKFKKFASVLTHIGFFSKSILYGSMGVVAMLAAVSSQRYTAEGPQSVIQELRTTFGLVIIIALTFGLFSYSFFAIFYAIFDIDRLGHHGAMPVLSRFGRCFSAGFYAFLGVVSAQTVASVKDNNNLSSELGRQLFSTTGGKCVIVLLGLIFLVVAIVYMNYALRPAKFYRELATERLHPYMFHIFVTVARVGACGRILFFGAFGVVLIDVVANNKGTDVHGTTVLGLEGVLLKIADFSATLLFVTGGLLFIYAVWCFILCFFRRLPAHYSQESAVHALGTRWRVRKLEVQQKNLQKKGIEVPITGRINIQPLPLEEMEEGTGPKPIIIPSDTITCWEENKIESTEMDKIEPAQDTLPTQPVGTPAR